MSLKAFIKNNLIWIVPLTFAGIIALLWFNQPKADRNFKPKAKPISVEVQKLQLEDITAQITSYGVVEPRINSKVIAQVTGRVIFIAEEFRDGGAFRKGDKLLGIEKADYEVQVEVARSNLAQAELSLQQELAESERAKQDWKRLGNSGTPPPLVLRVPQLEAAKANVRSAKASLKQAKLNLDRCDIRAPFDGRVLSNSVDLGQVVGTNTTIAEIYATDAVEIRLPIKNSELPFVALPETNGGDLQQYTDVEIVSELAGKETWQGKIVRTSGSIDSTSRQLYVVARIEDPFGEQSKGRFPLKIGQYVTANIQGKQINGVIAIPNRSLYQGSFVYVLKNDAVFRKEIDISWQNESFALIDKGLSPDEFLVLTPLGTVSSGTVVSVKNAKELGLEIAKAGKEGFGPPGKPSLSEEPGRPAVKAGNKGEQP